MRLNKQFKLCFLKEPMRDEDVSGAGAADAAPSNSRQAAALLAREAILLLSDADLLALMPGIRTVEEQQDSFLNWMDQPWRDQCNNARGHMIRYKLSGSGMSGFLRIPDHELLPGGGLYNRPHVAATITKYHLMRPLRKSIKDRTPDQVGDTFTRLMKVAQNCSPSFQSQGSVAEYMFV